MHHGLFTFHDDAKTSYDKMIELVTKAEDYLRSVDAFDNLVEASYEPVSEDYLELARARQAASRHLGFPMLTSWELDMKSVWFSMIDNIEDLATRARSLLTTRCRRKGSPPYSISIGGGR